MNKWFWASLFIAGAALSWGVYVPLVHRATGELKSNLRAFLMVGIAYFVVAVLVPAVFIFVLKNDPTEKAGANFNVTPMIWGFVAGTAGAVGALCVIFASNQVGALIVAPLVFAGAPIINTIVTLLFFQKSSTTPDYRFFLGLVLAAVGAAMVLYFKPPPDKAHGAAKPPASAIVATAVDKSTT